MQRLQLPKFLRLPSVHKPNLIFPTEENFQHFKTGPKTQNTTLFIISG